jgi:hypothetical protein
MRCWFSVSRTAATIWAVGLCSRAVSVVRTAASSVCGAMTTPAACSMPASMSTAARVASPWIAAKPDRVASSTASADSSMTTIFSTGIPRAVSVAMACRPFVPKPQMMWWSCKRFLQTWRR